MLLAGRVLITGGSGFLGRGILRRAKSENWPCEFIVYSRDEQKQALCKRKYPHAKYVIGDIRDTDRLKLVMLGVDTVIHTAAFKYVPEAEVNVGECISINVQGTNSVLLAAHDCDVSNVVVISTDKAVRPVNVYGMTKALTERLMSEMSALHETRTKFTGVRYGNVIGSTGSVVPELQYQAAHDGFVQMTDPDMTRFWITVDEAINLIDMALVPYILPGSIIIPRPRSMVLRDLIHALLPDTKIQVIGRRPGEKLHEDLLTESESLWTTNNGSSAYELRSMAYRTEPNDETFTLNSSDAQDMTEQLFLDAVEDAKLV